MSENIDFSAAPSWRPAPAEATRSIVDSTLAVLAAHGVSGANEALARAVYSGIYASLSFATKLASLREDIANFRADNRYPEDVCGLYKQGYRSAVGACVNLLETAIQEDAPVSLADIESAIRSLACVNPHAEDNCRLYDEGHRQACNAAAEMIFFAHSPDAKSPINCDVSVTA